MPGIHQAIANLLKPEINTNTFSFLTGGPLTLPSPRWERDRVRGDAIGCNEI
jgi:hypothetical protein